MDSSKSRRIQAYYPWKIGGHGNPAELRIAVKLCGLCGSGDGARGSRSIPHGGAAAITSLPDMGSDLLDHHCKPKNTVGLGGEAQAEASVPEYRASLAHGAGGHQSVPAVTGGVPALSRTRLVCRRKMASPR